MHRIAPPFLIALIMLVPLAGPVTSASGAIQPEIPWADSNWTHALEITHDPVVDEHRPHHVIGTRPIPVLDVFRVLYAVRAEGLLLILVLVSGLWLLRVFRRRHLVVGQPHCRRCLYQVSDLRDDTCPECGRSLRGWRATMKARNPRARFVAASFIVVGAVLLYVGWASRLPRHAVSPDLPRWPSRYAASVTERLKLTQLDELKSLHTEIVVVDVATGTTTEVVQRIPGVDGRVYADPATSRLTVLSRDLASPMMHVHELSRLDGTISYHRALSASFKMELVGATDEHLILTDRSGPRLWYFARGSGDVAETFDMHSFRTGPFPHAEPHGIVLHDGRLWRGLLSKPASRRTPPGSQIKLPGPEVHSLLYNWSASEPSDLEMTPIHGRYAPRPVPVGDVMHVVAVQDTALWVYPFDDPFVGRRVYTAPDSPNYRGGSLLGPDAAYVFAWHVNSMRCFGDVFERESGRHLARIPLSFPRYRSDAIVTTDGRYLVIPNEGVRPIVIEVYDLENLQFRAQG